jgi:Domain of unknown function (DUF4783)
MLRRLLYPLFLLLSGFAFAQADPKEMILAAFRAGNAEELARHMSPTIDLTVMGKGDVYGAAQAEQILRKFLSEHRPLEIQQEHQGASRTGDRYSICRLRTEKGSFRVTFFLKKDGGVLRMKQLRIETGNTE